MMIYKYYTADLMYFGDEKIQTPSITIKTWFWRNPVQVVSMMKNQLEYWNLSDHKIFNLRRIK